MRARNGGWVSASFVFNNPNKFMKVVTVSVLSSCIVDYSLSFFSKSLYLKTSNFLQACYKPISFIELKRVIKIFSMLL